MAAAAQTLRERISFKQDVPVEVQLDGDGNPTETTARDGSQEYRYFLTGHQIMWVPAEVHAHLTGMSPNALVVITKHKAPKTWTTVQIEDEPQDAAPAAPAHRESTDDRVARAVANVPRPQPQPAQRGPINTSQQQLPQLPGEEPYTASMYTALCAALRCAQAAEQYGQQIGRSVAFQTADVRAMAATLFIHSTGGGR